MRDQRHFLAQVRADDQHARGLLDLGDGAPEHRRNRIVGLVTEIDATQAMVEVVRADRARDLRGEREFLERRDRRRQHADLGRTRLAHDLLQALGRGFERGLPVDFAPGAAFLDHRLHGTIGRVEAFVAEAVAIGDPGLVDRFVRARHDAHDPAAQHVRAQVGADAIVRRHERHLRHFPGAGAVPVRLVVQRADRAQVDDVGRQLVVDALLDERRDHRLLAAADRAERRDARDFLAEPHAARAVDAARHVGGDERAEVLVLEHALALGIARHVAPEAHREVLQLALAALVADRAVERMVDQQELHRRLLRRDRLGRFREDLHALGDRRRAGRQRLRRLLDLDQAHAAVGRDAQLVVVAETRDVDAVGIRDLDDHGVLARLHRHAVDFDIDQLFAHGALITLRDRAPRRCCGRAR